MQSLQRKGRLGAYDLGAMLVQIARMSCSIRLTEVVLKLGAPIDYPVTGEPVKTVLAALQVAARQTTEKAAHLLRFLLFQRTATHGTYYKWDIGSERGAAQVQVWLGVTWLELCDQYQQGLK